MKYQLQKHFKRTLSVVIPLLFVIACGKPTTEEERLSKIGKIIDQKWMEITLGETTYRVQKDFVKGGKGKYGFVTGFRLWAYMPDFLSRKEVIKKYSRVPVEHWKTDIEFVFSYKPSVNHKPNYPYNNPQAYRLPYDLPINDIVSKKTKKIEYGLEYYDHGRSSWKDVYIYREAGDPRVLLNCNKNGEGEIPGCLGFLRFGTEVSVDIWMKKKHLKLWPFIWKKLNNIVHIME